MNDLRPKTKTEKKERTDSFEWKRIWNNRIFEVLLVFLVVFEVIWIIKILSGIEWDVLFDSSLFWIGIISVMVILIASFLQGDIEFKKKAKQIGVTILVICTIYLLFVSPFVEGEPGLKQLAEADFIEEKEVLDFSCAIPFTLTITPMPTVTIPDKSWVFFKSDISFWLIKRSGMNPDGSLILERIEMPPGVSKWFFPIGGDVYLEGKINGAKVFIM